MIKTSILFVLFMSFSVSVLADDIFHATSEDINEFDQFLEDQPMIDADKPALKKKEIKGDKIKPPPREAFNQEANRPPGPQGADGPRAQGDMKGPPRDDRERRRRRPPPGFGPEGGSKPPPPPGGSPPPPPPSN